MGRQVDLEEIIEYLNETHPYPPDIFPSGIGKASRIGYESCIHNIKQFVELKQKERKRKMQEEGAKNGSSK